MKRILQTLLLFIATSSISFAQYTLIPDAKFEAKLISLGIDKDGTNGKVLTSSIENVTSLNVAASQISDLTGIEGFTALTNLECSNNQLTNLNVTKNTNLNTLRCSSNLFSTIDLSKNTALKSLYCNYGNLSYLDLSKNLSIKLVFCQDNKLTNINVDKNIGLTSLICSNNNLTNLDVSKNKALDSLYCNNNTSLNIICVDNVSKFKFNFRKDASAIWSQNCLSSGDFTSSPKKLEYNTIALDTVSRFIKGRNTISTCTTTSVNENTIDAFYSFVATETNPTIELNLGNPAWLSAIELIDTLSFTNTNNSCQKSSTNALRTYTFSGLTIGQKYMLRIEIGSTSALGFARMETTNNTFSVKLLGNVTDIDSETINPTKTISVIYNLQGVEVNSDYKGLVIYKFTDGSTQKVLQ